MVTLFHSDLLNFGTIIIVVIIVGGVRGSSDDVRGKRLVDSPWPR